MKKTDSKRKGKENKQFESINTLLKRRMILNVNILRSTDTRSKTLEKEISTKNKHVMEISLKYVLPKRIKKKIDVKFSKIKANL